jgi:hypothetical protein
MIGIARVAIVGGMLLVCGCASSPKKVEQALMWKLDETCRLADNPAIIAGESGTIAVDGELGEEPDVVVTIPVQIDPALAVRTRWVAKGPIREGEVAWWRLQVAPEEGRFRSDRANELILALGHRDDGSLELVMLGWDYLNIDELRADIRVVDDAVHAEVRGRNEFEDSVDGVFIEREWSHVQGELRLSNASWVAGDELGVFVEFASQRELVCGELRFVMPERGEAVLIECRLGKCTTRTTTWK